MAKQQIEISENQPILNMYSNWLKSFVQTIPFINGAKQFLVNFTFLATTTQSPPNTRPSPGPQMKHNNIIDFFSSPNSRFIGFSDIRHPQQEIPHTQYQPADEQKKYHRKLSFTVSGNVEPIMPFGMDFFDEKLEECEEPQEYSEEKEEVEINENSLMMEAQFGRVGYQLQLMKSPHIHPKQPQYLSTPHTMRIQCQDRSPYPAPQPTSHPQPATAQLFSTPRRKSYQPFSARKSCESTAQKSISRNNQKGLRRLSSLAFSIVSQSTTTTYKQVAEKLLNHLNFSIQMDQEDGPDRSSMQNVKRRVYDSLNVLLALGVIKRVGSKIAKQKQRKPFTTDTSPDLQRYNEMLAEYNQRVKALEMRKKTQQQLKEKLQVFRRTVQRNRKTKQITKGNNNTTKMIKLPFLAFVSNEEAGVEWVKKEPTAVVVTDGQEKKKASKRGQRNQNEKTTQQQDQCVKVSFKGCPQSYGDLDVFRLLQQESENVVVSKENVAQSNLPLNAQELQEFQYQQRYSCRLKRQEEEMNLIDQVLMGSD